MCGSSGSALGFCHVAETIDPYPEPVSGKSGKRRCDGDGDDDDACRRKTAPLLKLGDESAALRNFRRTVPPFLTMNDMIDCFYICIVSY